MEIKHHSAAHLVLLFFPPSLVGGGEPKVKFVGWDKNGLVFKTKKKNTVVMVSYNNNDN